MICLWNYENCWTHNLNIFKVSNCCSYYDVTNMFVQNLQNQGTHNKKASLRTRAFADKRGHARSLVSRAAQRSSQARADSDEYHEHFGDGADREHIHGDAHLHWRTCNQAQEWVARASRLAPWKPNQRIRRTWQDRSGRLRDRTVDTGATMNGNAGDRTKGQILLCMRCVFNIALNTKYHFDFRQRADGEHVHGNPHFHGWSWKRHNIHNKWSYCVAMMSMSRGKVGK